MSVGFFKKRRVRKYNVGTKRDRKKDDIVRAAVELFIERGFDRVSLSDVAAKLNLGRTTIYEYFNNKNEILASHLEKEMYSYHEKVKAIFIKKADIKDRLREFIRLQLEYGNYHRGFSQLFSALSKNAKAMSAKTEAVIREKHQEIYGMLTAEFNHAVQSRMIRDISPGLIMQLLINATSFPVKTNEDQQKTSEAVFSIFWSGISKK